MNSKSLEEEVLKFVCSHFDCFVVDFLEDLAIAADSRLHSFNPLLVFEDVGGLFYTGEGVGGLGELLGGGEDTRSSSNVGASPVLAS